MTDVCALASLPPSEKAWMDLVRALSALEGEPLARAVADAGAVTAWPARLRAVGSNNPWLAGVFEGARDPRLELVGWASVRHVHRYADGGHSVGDVQTGRVLLEFARHLDPAFDPPNAVIEKGDDIAHAYGCGGGTAWEKIGNAAQGVEFRDVEVEHCDDTESTGDWVVYGLSEGRAITVHRKDYFGGEFVFSATGPAPALFEIAASWGRMTRERVDVLDVRDALRATRRDRAPRAGGR